MNFHHLLWHVRRLTEESPVMLGAVLLMGGMWGYPGGPIREEMFCLESMYMFPVGEQTKGQWLTVRLASWLSHICLAEHELLSWANRISLPLHAKPDKSYRICCRSEDSPLGKHPPCPQIFLTVASKLTTSIILLQIYNGLTMAHWAEI